MKMDMLCLIAESKTMTACDNPVTQSELEAHLPAGSDTADEVMKNIMLMKPDEVADAVRISLPMAVKLVRMAYEFPNKHLGSSAIEAYTGVVFKQFDYASLDMKSRGITNDSVRIVSSLYGWLHPWDIIKAYRLDFSTPLALGGISFNRYWRKDVTSSLIEELRSGGIRNVIDLLPGDAAKCIDRDAVQVEATIWKIDFLELRDGMAFPEEGDEFNPSAWRTPNAGKLKKLRGELLRAIVSRPLESIEDIRRYHSENLLPLPHSLPGHIAFCV